MYSALETKSQRNEMEAKQTLDEPNQPSKVNVSIFSRLSISAVVILVLIVGSLLYFYGARSVNNKFIVLPLPLQQPVNLKTPHRCPDVLKYMTKGQWSTRTITDTEHGQIQKAMGLFYSENPKRITFLPAKGKCGNVSYPGSITHRTLCDPNGPMPCCYQGVCVKLPVEKCRCQGCFDVRQRIHAEFSKWRPTKLYCSMKTYSAAEVCRLLKGYTVHIVGDSFLRHFYQGMLIVMTNGTLEGVYRSRLSKGKMQLCKGMNIFTLSKCKLSLNFASTNMCKGTVNIHYKQHTRSLNTSELYQTLRPTLGKKKHIFIASTGLHDNYNLTKTRNYVLPTLQLLKKTKVRWPKLVWLAYHAPGLSKSPRYLKQGYLPTKRYNEEVQRLLQPFGIPIMDTFNLTQNTFSYDGTHYGLGVVITKVHLLFNYIEEQQRKHYGRRRVIP